MKKIRIVDIIGIILLPLKIIAELLDPVLRFFEMAIIIPFSFVLENIVDLFNMIPSIYFVSTGEAFLGIVSGVLFYFLSTSIFHWEMLLIFRILLSVLVAIVGYFVSYIIFKYLLNLFTSLISLIIVAIRVAIYLPGSVWLTVSKVGISFLIWGAYFLINYNNIISSFNELVISMVVLVVIMIIVSIMVLIIRKDVKFNDLGNFGDATLEDLSAFTHSIGLYIITAYGIPIYIGRAIEFKNGGLRKRLRDYQRGVNIHSSGKWIQENIDELRVYVLELGHTGEDVESVTFAETSMISKIYTKLNKVDATENYIINILGYIIGASIAVIVCKTFFSETIFVALGIYSICVCITCIVIYVLENKNKW